MGFIGNMISAAGAAYTAFHERMLNADPAQDKGGHAFSNAEWNRHAARATRYDLYWGLYQNNAYRDLVHHYAARYKTSFGASKSIRHLYNPAYRLGEFWAGHLMGGLLDPMAGNGESELSALPILTENESLRPAIAKLWKDSSWQVKKEILSRWGAVMGDVGIKIIDDTKKGEVRKELVHPSHLRWVDFDDQGCVKAYIIRKRVNDPRVNDIANIAPGIDPLSLARPVFYEERAFRDGETVVYQTFLNEMPFAWNGENYEWEEPYGFIPLVVVPHESIGMEYGQNCFHAGLSRFMEVDDQASCLGDGNRKDLKAPHYISGAAGPKDLKQGGADRATRTARDDIANPEPSRTEMGFLYGPPLSTAMSLCVPRKIGEIVEHIRALNEDIEKNYPELLADTGNLGGTVTAEAIRNARQQASSKVQTRRVGYFHGEICSTQMAVAIGGFRKYKGYGGFGLESYKAGKLDFQIGHTPVFEVDPLDAINEDAAFWAACGAAVTAGVPLSLYLERNGWSKEDLAALAKAKAAEPKPDDQAASAGNTDEKSAGVTK